MFERLRTIWFSRLVYLVLFLLPWQTRYIFEEKLLQGEVWEYGKLSVYAVELLVLVCFFIGQRLQVLEMHKKPLKRIGIILFAIGILSLFSLNQDLSFNYWTHLMIAGLLFVLLLDQRVKTIFALSAFVGGLILPSILGFFQFFSGIAPESSWLGLALHSASQLGPAVIETGSERFLRAYGTFSHPNVFGGYLAVGLVVLNYLFFRFRSLKNIHFSSFLFPFSSFYFLLSFSFVLTFSRSAWLSFFSACCVILFVFFWKRRDQIKIIFPSFAILALFLLVPIIIFSPLIISRFQPSLPLEERSISERLSQYESYWPVTSDNLFFGSGIGTYTLSLAEKFRDQSVWNYQPIHNVLLLILSEVGIVGLALVIFWAASVDRINYAAIAQGNVGAIFGIGLGTVLLVLVFFDHYLWSSWSGLALMAFAMSMTLRISGRE